MIIVTSIICGTVFISLLSVLIYFAVFHNTRKYSSLEQLINTCESRIALTEDELRQINNKINFRGKSL